MKHHIKYIPRILQNGLFWKVFAAIWFTNLALLFAASFFVISKLEHATHLEKHQQHLDYLSDRLIERHEQRDEIVLIRQKDIDRKKHWPEHLRYSMFIEDLSGRVVVQRGRPITKPTDIEFTFSSSSGKDYIVYSSLPESPSFIQTALYRFMSLRLILILIASTIASALISWRIATPLRQLSEYNQKFASSVKAEALPEDLISRRDEIGNLAKETEAMAQQVEATLENQKQLLHNVSHELRAPLARLQAAIGLLEQSSCEPATVKMIDKECDRIHALIQEILDFSRLKQSTENKQQFNLLELVQDCITNCQAINPSREFKTTLPETPVLIIGYPDAMYSALENVISNANKYSPENSPILINIAQSNQQTVIEVIDQGDGVKGSELQKLSQPFYRSGNHGPKNGFGLGLSIAARAIDKHQGTLRFENVLPKGFKARMEMKNR